MLPANRLYIYNGITVPAYIFVRVYASTKIDNR